ncbi:competence protein ComEA [Persephonella hydrogeniphila]|uniref:Competence protein ComEA n=1 Tax=Persephonella hydrogeniphila TaxID=198703 RepID=A0A285NMG6_9AQUI|nr:helix-hairpin-helix domain-containing protein [Persephonella hydrogeniphila]SNZ10123.1 competence protein ComEA [Persephonella hydrogeniphila]
MSRFFNLELLKYQVYTTVFTVFFSVFGLSLFYTIYTPHKPEELKLDINTADYYDLLKVPFIGRKTAEKILKIREEYGFVPEEEIKKLRYYKKFKYFIRVE